MSEPLTVIMTVYVKGPRSHVEDEYIAIVTGEIVTWHYPDKDPIVSTTAIPNRFVKSWIEGREWKKISLPKHVKIALRLCKREDIYKIVTEGVKKMPGKQGFASMTPERRREMARLGGRAAHILRRGHEWTSEQAREAGRKGGAASKAKAVRNKELIANMGEHVQTEQAESSTN